MLRVGRIDYVNCDPLFRLLEPSDAVEIVRAVPSVLNRMLREGELDVSAVSSIEFARSSQAYLLVPQVGIAAQGAIRSVLLLSPAPVRELDGAEIFLAAASATTVVLLRLLLAHRFGVRAATREWERDGKLPDGPIMLIGDPALTVTARASHPHVYDLCAEWVAWTGLPMTFALVCVRRDAVARKGREVQAVARAVRAAAKAWPAGIDETAGAAGRLLGMPRESMRDYLAGLQFWMTPRHLAGLERYYQLAAEAGELPAVPTLRFLEIPERDGLEPGLIPAGV